MSNKVILNPFSGELLLVPSGSAGSGDFVGPSSSTDNAVVRFDGTTGKLGQNSLVIIDDTGIIHTTGYMIIGDASFQLASDRLNTSFGFRLGFSNGAESALSILGNNVSQAFRAMLEIQPNKSTNVGLIIKPFATATANLAEFRDENDNILSYVDHNGVGSWENPGATSTMFDDFVGDDVPSVYGWTSAAVGAASANTLFSSALLNGHPGVLMLQTGTADAGDIINIGTSDNPCMVFGNSSSLVGEWLINIPTLATVPADYTIAVGFMNNIANTTAGAYFGYIRTSGKWTTFVGNHVDSGQVVSTLSMTTGWHKLRIEGNSAGTSLVFKVDGTIIATRSDNIPTDATQDAFFPAFEIANLNGATNNIMYVDYSYVKSTSTR